MQLTFAKGHGTENDFVLLPDPDGQVQLTPSLVRRLADRHAGIGADGVIRVVRTRAVPDQAHHADRAEWFMDYRNADGETAQMCGNGVRVLVAYLVREQLVGAGPVQIATRAGVKVVHLLEPHQAPPGAGAAGEVRQAVPETEAGTDEAGTDVAGSGVVGAAVVGAAGDGAAGDGAGGDGAGGGVPWFGYDLGEWRLPAGTAALADGGDVRVTAAGLDGSVPGLSVNVGNPHTVVLVPSAAELARLDLSRPPVVDPAPVEGTNVEFVVLALPDDLPDDLPADDASDQQLTRSGRLRMRVHERGVGETRSCGTGAVAAAMAARTWTAAAGVPAPDRWWVHVPGGTVRVTALPGDRAELAGPAVLVADGTVTV
ncbi:MAG: diaminopimelate epimerase [Angustibacter sp.]